VPVTEVEGRVPGQEVEVPVAVDVGDPGPLRLRDDDGQGVVVVGAPLLVEGDEVAGNRSHVLRLAAGGSSAANPVDHAVGHADLASDLMATDLINAGLMVAK
jgi:hypothetical protein